MNFKKILKLSIWENVKKIKKGKKLESLSTNDLNTDRTLKENHKNLRKKGGAGPKGYSIGPDL